MGFARTRRPLAISILATVTISLSLWAIAFRWIDLQTMSIVEQTARDGEVTVNIDLVSGISAIALCFIPLILGIGLWLLLAWARMLSICLFSAVLLPSLGAALGLVADPYTSPQNNALITVGCAIALWILWHPSAIKAFSKRHHYSK
jgi:uncharacterized membrane protein (DUF2068 family)